jgi:hypothetical protein
MVFHRINGCLATKDNHDSCGMCTTSAECKTVMIVVLTVISGMDPHKIRVTWVGMVGMLGWLVSCDRTTSEMRGLSPKIISGDSRRNENAQTHTHKHTIPNMKFKLKLLQIKCHVLGFTKDIAQNELQKIIRVFAEAFVSHDRHTLFALEESEPPQTTYTREFQ